MGSTAALTGRASPRGTRRKGVSGTFGLAGTNAEAMGQAPAGSSSGQWYPAAGNRGEIANMLSHEQPVPFTTGKPGQPQNPQDAGVRYGAFVSGGISDVSGVSGDNGGPVAGSGGNAMAGVPLPGGTGGSNEGRPSDIKLKNPAQEREMERLRRIEANYEKDKAMLAKEKVPALARSDSHEVGHAEGTIDREPDNPKRVGTLLFEAFMDAVKRI